MYCHVYLMRVLSYYSISVYNIVLLLFLISHINSKILVIIISLCSIKYYMYGMSGPSLHRRSTDSLISVLCNVICTHLHGCV